MDVQKTIKLFEEVIKQYEKSEAFSIFAYSSNYERDFKIMNDKVADYRNKLNKIIADGTKDPKQIRDITGTKDIQAELL